MDPLDFWARDASKALRRVQRGQVPDGSGNAIPIASGGLPGNFSGFANPTASVGLAVVGGSTTTTTAMRSDAAPPLDQSIAPTWTSLHIFSHVEPAVRLSNGAGLGKIATDIDGLGSIGLRAPSSLATRVQQRWTANGFYILDTSFDDAYVAPTAFTISAVRIWRRSAGTSGSTIVDLNKNAVTMYTTQANRPTLTTVQTSVLATNPDITSVAAGDILTVDIDTVEAGTPSDLALLIEGA